jgi:hypothetical protein
MKPTIGRIVIYRSHIGDYDLPAIVTATVETPNRADVEKGYVPELSSAEHVHLTVFTPAVPGVGSIYQGWDVPPAAPVEGKGFIESQATPAGEPGPGTWRWPERVS